MTPGRLWLEPHDEAHRRPERRNHSRGQEGGEGASHFSEVRLCCLPAPDRRAEEGREASGAAQTIYSYERGESKPRPAQLAKLVAMRNLGKREAERRLALLKG